MKKLILIMIIVMSVFLVPSVAYANSPPHRSTNLEILIDDYTQISEIQILGINDGEEEIHEILSLEHLVNRKKTLIQNQRIYKFYAEGYDHFYLVVTNKDNKIVTTNVQKVNDYGQYIYSKENNSLDQHIISNRVQAIILIFRLLIITIFIECIIALFFKLRPLSKVIKINAITNPAMNIFFFILLSEYEINYSISILVLELVVVIAEYLYYKNAFSDKSKVRLALFTLTANISSWGIHSLFTWLF